MGVYKEMDPELAWKLIEGYDNALEGPARVQEAFYRQFSCPRCKCNLEKKFDSRHVWGGDSLVARALLKCPLCGYVVEPDTNLVVEYGDASKIPVETIPIVGQK